MEADALKVRLLNEISEEEAKTAPLTAHEEHRDDQPLPVRKKKTVSIKSVNSATTWQIETIEDVDQYLKELRKKLIGTLEDNTIINIEF